MSRLNGRHPEGGGGEDLIAVPEEEFRDYGETLEAFLPGGEQGWIAAAGGAAGVAFTTLSFALLRPTRFPPLVTAGTVASAGCWVVYWYRSHPRRRRVEATLGLINSRLSYRE